MNIWCWIILATSTSRCVMLHENWECVNVCSFEGDSSIIILSLLNQFLPFSSLNTKYCIYLQFLKDSLLFMTLIIINNSSNSEFLSNLNWKHTINIHLMEAESRVQSQIVNFIFYSYIFFSSVIHCSIFTSFLKRLKAPGSELWMDQVRVLMTFSDLLFYKWHNWIIILFQEILFPFFSLYAIHSP